jgi:hypothetical protein
VKVVNDARAVVISRHNYAQSRSLRSASSRLDRVSSDSSTPNQRGVGRLSSLDKRARPVTR